jgi:hypothetical protein
MSISCVLIFHLICVGKYYVVDVSYPNRPGYLAPYKGERYHLPEYHRGMEPNSSKEKFNRIHSSIRNVIERSFALWKNKRQILYKMPKYSMLTQKKIVASTMVLYNYIHEHSSDDVDFANYDRDPNFVPTRIDTTSMQCHLMPLMIQLLKQVFLRWMHFVIVWLHPFLLRGVE